jgi:hypothetical protein
VIRDVKADSTFAATMHPRPSSIQTAKFERVRLPLRTQIRTSRRMPHKGVAGRDSTGGGGGVKLLAATITRCEEVGPESPLYPLSGAISGVDGVMSIQLGPVPSCILEPTIPIRRGRLKTIGRTYQGIDLPVWDSLLRVMFTRVSQGMYESSTCCCRSGCRL